MTNSHSWDTLADDVKRGDGLLVLEGYCDSTDCQVREVTIRVKDNDHVFVNQSRAGLVCPVCRHPLKRHGVETFQEAAARKELGARTSVNVQRYKRDHADGERFVFVPLDVLTDDSLPR